MIPERGTTSEIVPLPSITPSPRKGDQLSPSREIRFYNLSEEEVIPRHIIAVVERQP